jgi:hypothetical protein
MAQFGLAVLVVLALGGQLAATAQPQAVDTTAETHCVVYVTDQLASGELVVTAPLCFDSFADAIEEASEGEVKISSGSELFTDPETGALLATFTLGIHYDGYSGAGSSITVVGGSCTGGWWNTGAAWANRISSSYNGCYRLRHHDLPDRQGIYGDTTGSGAVHNVPAPINNKAESVSYWGS